MVRALLADRTDQGVLVASSARVVRGCSRGSAGRRTRRGQRGEQCLLAHRPSPAGLEGARACALHRPGVVGLVGRHPPRRCGHGGGNRDPDLRPTPRGCGRVSGRESSPIVTALASVLEGHADQRDCRQGAGWPRSGGVRCYPAVYVSRGEQASRGRTVPHPAAYGRIRSSAGVPLGLLGPGAPAEPDEFRAGAESVSP